MFYLREIKDSGQTGGPTHTHTPRPPDVPGFNQSRPKKLPTFSIVYNLIRHNEITYCTFLAHVLSQC